MLVDIYINLTTVKLPFQAGQLGDGRAILLGEYANSKGEHWELQLKGIKSFYQPFVKKELLLLGVWLLHYFDLQ